MALTCTPEIAFETTKVGYNAKVTCKITKIHKTTVSWTKTFTLSWKGAEIFKAMSDNGRKTYIAGLEKKWEKKFKSAVSKKAKSYAVDNWDAAKAKNKKYLDTVLSAFKTDITTEGKALFKEAKKALLQELEKHRKETLEAVAKTVKGVHGTVTGAAELATSGGTSGYGKTANNIVKTVKGLKDIKNAKYAVRVKADKALVDAEKAINKAAEAFGKTEILIQHFNNKADDLCGQAHTNVPHYLDPKLSPAAQDKEKKVKKQLKNVQKKAQVLGKTGSKDFKSMMSDLAAAQASMEKLMSNVRKQSKSLLDRMEEMTEAAEELEGAING